MSGDAEIEALEAELRRSQFAPWDVETFLIERHNARIAELQKPRGQWKRRWQVTVEIANACFVFVGQITVLTLLGVGLLNL